LKIDVQGNNVNISLNGINRIYSTGIIYPGSRISLYGEGGNIQFDNIFVRKSSSVEPNISINVVQNPQSQPLY
jgi:hypothetical protein